MNKNNDNKNHLEKPALLTELIILINRCEPAFGQKRVFNRVLALVMAELFAFGRHTVTQLLLTSGFTAAAQALAQERQAMLVTLDQMETDMRHWLRSQQRV